MSEKIIGIVAAMEKEKDAIAQTMNIETKEKFGGVEFLIGTLAGYKTILAQSGVGKVQAAIAATLLASKYNVNLLISIGVAGGLKKDQNPLELVIADSLVQADFDTSPLDGPEGLCLFFKPSEELVKKAKAAADALFIENTVGTIVTQDLFVAREEDYARIFERVENAAAAEMEAGAIAAVAKAFDIDLLSLRTLSDVVGHEGNPMEFTKFAELAGTQAAEFLLNFLTTQDI